MKGTIIVIDDQNKIAPILQRVVDTKNYLIEEATDFVSAKVKLINLNPLLVIARMKINNDPDAGCVFCLGLKDHHMFCSIPVFLVEENVSDEAIRKASSHGAKGLLPWPISINALSARLNGIIPGIVSQDKFSTKIYQKPTLSEDKEKTEPATVNVAPVQKDKLQLAQQLLAKVLHDLKTSDLLQVVEVEDVPQIVYEITRKVCGIKSSEKQIIGPKQSHGGNLDDQEVSVDLSQIFTHKS